MRHVELREWGARNYFPCTDQYQIQLILTSTDQISVSIWRTIHVATFTVFTVNDFTRARLKFKIHDQLIRTKDFSPLPHPLRNPPPSHLLHKSLLPSPPCTSYTIHPSPLTQATLSLTSSTLHPFPHLSCNPPLPSPLIQSTPPLPARLTQLTPPLPYPLITLAVSAQAVSQSTAHLGIRWIVPGETKISQLMHLYSGTTEEQPVKLEAWIYL